MNTSHFKVNTKQTNKPLNSIKVQVKALHSFQVVTEIQFSLEHTTRVQISHKVNGNLWPRKLDSG